MHWMLHKPRLAVVLFALFLFAPGPLLLTIKLDNAPEIYFPEDAPAVVFDQALREQFPQDQVLVALFQGDDLYEAAFLQKLDSLVQSLEVHPDVDRVLAVTTMDQIRATPEGFAVELVIDPLALEQTTATQRRERASLDRFAPGTIVAPEGDAMAVVLRPSPMETSLQRLELEQLLRQQIDATGLSSELTAVAGHVALDVAQLRAMIVDLATLIPGTMGIGLLLLWWLFRRWLVVALAAATIAAVTGMSVGLMVILGKPFTLISAIIPPLLAALTVAMLMHLFNAILHAAQRGLEGEERVRTAIDSVASPIAYTALTTAAGPGLADGQSDQADRNLRHDRRRRGAVCRRRGDTAGAGTGVALRPLALGGATARYALGGPFNRSVGTPGPAPGVLGAWRGCGAAGHRHSPDRQGGGRKQISMRSLPRNIVSPRPRSKLRTTSPG